MEESPPTPPPPPAEEEAGEDMNDQQQLQDDNNEIARGGGTDNDDGDGGGDDDRTIINNPLQEELKDNDTVDGNGNGNGNKGSNKRKRTATTTDRDKETRISPDTTNKDEVYYYYAILKSDSLQKPAIFCSYDDCSFYLSSDQNVDDDDDDDNTEVVYKKCTSLKDAVKFIEQIDRDESDSDSEESSVTPQKKKKRRPKRRKTTSQSTSKKGNNENEIDKHIRMLGQYHKHYKQYLHVERTQNKKFVSLPPFLKRTLKPEIEKYLDKHTRKDSLLTKKQYNALKDIEYISHFQKQKEKQASAQKSSNDHEQEQNQEQSPTTVVVKAPPIIPLKDEKYWIKNVNKLKRWYNRCNAFGNVENTTNQEYNSLPRFIRGLRYEIALYEEVENPSRSSTNDDEADNNTSKTQLSKEQYDELVSMGFVQHLKDTAEKQRRLEEEQPNLEEELAAIGERQRKPTTEPGQPSKWELRRNRKFNEMIQRIIEYQQNQRRIQSTGGNNNNANTIRTQPTKEEDPEVFKWINQVRYTIHKHTKEQNKLLLNSGTSNGDEQQNIEDGTAVAATTTTSTPNSKDKPIPYSSLQLTRLSALGITISMKQKRSSLDERIAEFVQYQEQQKQLTGEDPPSNKLPPERLSIGKWVRHTREKYMRLVVFGQGGPTTIMNNDGAQQQQQSKSPPLTEEAITKLSEVNFPWPSTEQIEAYKSRKLDNPMPPPKKRTWEESYQLLVEYKNRHGHTLVKQQDGHLGQWVHDQRTKYRIYQQGQQGRTLSQDQLSKLIDIGFVFNVKNYMKQQQSSSTSSTQAMSGTAAAGTARNPLLSTTSPSKRRQIHLPSTQHHHRSSSRQNNHHSNNSDDEDEEDETDQYNNYGPYY